MARRVRISNGSICGCQEVCAKLAISMLSNGDALIDGDPADFRIKLTFRTIAHVVSRDLDHKARALWNGSYRAALTATQCEELYQGLRHPGHGQTPSDGPVSAKLTVIRKYRRGEGLRDWGEKETFPRRRFNPDKIAPHIYRTEAEYRLSENLCR